MNPFTYLFGLIVSLRNHAYDHQWLASGKLQYPVVSVGNLSVGGSGKTPFLIALGKLLQARGVAFDVLSRGYGRKDNKIRLVEDVEENGGSEIYGDEPLLLLRGQPRRKQREGYEDYNQHHAERSQNILPRQAAQPRLEYPYGCHVKHYDSRVTGKNPSCVTMLLTI